MLGVVFERKYARKAIRRLQYFKDEPLKELVGILLQRIVEQGLDALLVVQPALSLLQTLHYTFWRRNRAPKRMVMQR
jgi:hypothetical protein